MKMKSSAKWGISITFLVLLTVFFAYYVVPVFAAPTAQITFNSPIDAYYNTTSSSVIINITSNSNLNWSIVEWGNSSGTYNHSMTNETDDLTWNITMSGLVDYTYHYTVWVDALADNDNKSALRFITVDYTDPNVTLVSPANNYNFSSGTMNLTFNVTDNVATVLNCSLYLNGILNATNSSVLNGTDTNFSVAGLSEGSHNWTVNCSDDVGNSHQAAELNFIVDRTAPNVTIIFPYDGYYTAYNFTLNVSASDAGTGIYENVRYRWENSTQNGTWPGLTNISGYWNATFDVSQLQDGNYTIRINATDWAGVYNSTETVNITVETVAPVVTLVSPINEYNCTSSSVNFTFNVTDTLSYAMNCWMKVNGTIIGNINGVPNATDTAFNISGLSEDLDQTWTVNCSNSAGLSHQPTVRNIFIDYTAPAVTIISPTEEYHNTNFTVNVSASDASIGLNTVTYRWENSTQNSTWTELTNISGYWNDTFNINEIEDGDYIIRINATDFFGVENTTETVSVTIDRVDPVVTLLFPPNSINTTNTTVDFTFNVVDGPGIRICHLYVNGTPAGSVAVLANDTTYTFSRSVTEGLGQNWTLDCIDWAYNNHKPAVSNFSTDYTAPAVTINSPDTIAHSGTIEMNVSVTDAALKNVTYRWENLTQNGTWTALGLNSGYWTDLFVINSLQDGNYTIRINATDWAGLYNSTETVDIIIDNTPPTITITSPTNGTLYSDAPAMAGNCSDNFELYRARTNLTEYANEIISGTSDTFSYGNLSGLTDQDYTAIIYCEDAALNSASGTVHFTFSSTSGNVLGYVRDAEGTAMESVTVDAFQSGSLIESYVTSSDGSFIIALLAGSYNMSFSKANYVTANVSNVTIASNITINMTMYLQNKGGYNVTVVDARNGRPIENASIQVSWQPAGNKTATTDSNGLALLEVPANDSVVYPDGVFHDFVVTADGYITNSSITGLSILEGWTYHFVISLEGSCSITGRVKDSYRWTGANSESSAPGISGAYVEVWNFENTAKLNFSGQYFYNTTSSSNGYYSMNFPSTIMPSCNPKLHVSNSGYTSDNDVIVTGSGEKNISLTGNSYVDGYVVDANNLSYRIPDAIVRIWKDGSIIYQADTDSNGAFNISVRGGEYRNLTGITKSGYDPWNDTTVYTTTKSYGQIALTGSAVFSGTLVDWQNTSILLSGVQVTISGNGDSYNTTTNSTGEFLIAVSGSQDYDLVFSKAGYDNNDTYTSQSASALGTITMLGKNHITGTITDPLNMVDQHPDNVNVRVNSSSNSNTYSVTAGTNGQYSIYIPSTITTYNVIFDKGIYYNRNIVASADPNSPIINVNLLGATHIEGYVRDNQNLNPIEGAYIEFFANSSGVTYYNATTDANGHYSIDMGIEMGYKIKASKSGYNTLVNGTVYSPGVDMPTHDIYLIGNRSIDITVIDAQDSSPINTALVCVFFDETQPEICTYSANTNTNGTASLNIIANPYKIRINKNGYLQKIVPDSGYYTSDFNNTVVLTARAGMYVYDSSAMGQQGIPYATVVAYEFNSTTNYSYTLNHTVLNVTATCNSIQRDGLNVSATGITYTHYSSNLTAGGQLNATLEMVPKGSNNLTVDGSSVGCGISSNIINIPSSGDFYNYAYDVDMTSLIVKVVDQVGTAIPNINVSSIASPNANCTTDTNGTCTITYMPGWNQTLNASDGVYFVTNKSYIVSPGQINNVTDDPIVMIPTSGNLSVFVQNASSLAVPGGVNVTISNSTFTNSTLTVSGWANFTGLTSLYNITVNATPQGYNWTNATNVYVYPNQTTVHTITLASNTLTVHVNGSVIANANVTLWDPTGTAMQLDGYGNYLTGNTDGNGNVTFFAIPLETYNITASKTGYQSNYITYEMSMGTHSATIEMDDSQAPWYSSISQTDPINENLINQLRTTWQDNKALSYAWLETNRTGSFVNESYQAISGTNYVVTFNINTSGYGNRTIAWRMYANDTGGRTNETGTNTFYVTDVIAPYPTFVDPTPDDSSTITDRYDWFYVNVTTNENVDTALLYLNGTLYGGDGSMSGSGTNWYKNVTTAANNQQYNFSVWVNDTFGNARTSETRTILVNATANLTIQVQDVSTSPIQGVNVTVRSDSVGYTSSQMTSGSGSVKFTGLENVTYNITVDGANLGYGNVSFLKTLSFGENTNTTTLGMTSVTFNITDYNGDPVFGATVTLYNGLNSSYPVAEEYDGDPITGLTDVNGFRTFTRVKPCTSCNLSISKTIGSEIFNSSIVNIVAGSSQTIHLDPQAPFFPELYTLNFTINSGDDNADGINISARYNDTGDILTTNTTINGTTTLTVLSDVYDFVINGSIAGWSDLVIEDVKVGKTIVNNGTTDLSGQATMTVIGTQTYYIRVIVGGYVSYDDMDNGTSRAGSYDPSLNGSISIPMAGTTNLTVRSEDENFITPVLGYEPISNSTISVYTASDCGSLSAGLLRYQFETPKTGINSINISPRQRLDPDSNQSFCIKVDGIGFTSETFGPFSDLASASSHNFGLTGNSTITGYVRDAISSQNLSNANILLTSSECYNATGPPFPASCNAYTTTTNANGFFTVQVNSRIDATNYSPDYVPYGIRVSRINYNQTTGTISSVPSYDNQFSLTPAGKAWINVNVTSGSANLTGSVLITLDGTPINLSAPYCFQNGNTLTCAIDDGTYNLIADGSAQGYGINSTNFTILVDQNLNFNIHLNETGMNITLVSDEGEALPNVTVALEGTSFSGLTNATGSVQFSVVPTGSYNMTMSGYNVSSVYFYNATAPGNRANLNVSSAGSLNSQTFTLNETRALINLFNETSFAANLTAMLTGSTYTFQSDANSTGQVVFRRVPYDNYTLSFNSTQLYNKGYKPTTATLNIQAGQDENSTNNFSQTLDDIKLKFNSVNTTGDSIISNITVYLNGTMATNGYGQNMTGQTSSNLTFNNTVPSDYADNYTFSVNANTSGYGIWTGNNLTVGLNGTNVSVILSPLNITIYLRNQSLPLEEGVNVSIYWKDGGQAQNALGQDMNSTGISDNVTFTHLFAGNYTIIVNSSMYFDQMSDFTAEGTLTETQPNVFESTGGQSTTLIFTKRTLDVNLYEMTGSTITENMTVTLYNSTGDVPMNTTADGYLNGTTVSGTIRISGIPDGSYNISVSGANWTTQNQTFDTSAGDYTKDFFLFKINYGYFNVTSSQSSSTVSILNGTTTIATGTASPSVVLGVNTSLYSSGLNVTVSKAGYDTNTTGPYSISNQELKNLSITLTASSVTPPYVPPGGGTVITGGSSYGPPACSTDWTCTSWGLCVDGEQSRVCTDSNDCGTSFGKPEETQSCTASMEAAMGAVYLNGNDCVTAAITIENTGTVTLGSVKAETATITECCSITSPSISVPAGQTGTLSVQFCAPKMAKKGDYEHEIAITSDQADTAVMAYVFLTKEYSEILLEEILALQQELGSLTGLGAQQLEWLNLANIQAANAKDFALANVFESAEEALQAGNDYLSQIKNYVAEAMDVSWLLYMVPVALIGGAVFWWLRVRKPGYKYKPSSYTYPVRYDKGLLLKELGLLDQKVSKMDGKKLRDTDKIYYDRAVNSLGNMKQSVEEGNLMSAKRFLNSAETNIKVLESRILSMNVMKTFQK